MLPSSPKAALWRSLDCTKRPWNRPIYTNKNLQYFNCIWKIFDCKVVNGSAAPSRELGSFTRIFINKNYFQKFTHFNRILDSYKIVSLQQWQFFELLLLFHQYSTASVLMGFWSQVVLHAPSFPLNSLSLIFSVTSLSCRREPED